MRDGENHQSSEYLKRQAKFSNIRTTPEKEEVVSGLNVPYHSTQINLKDCASEEDQRFHSAVGEIPDDQVHEVHPYQTEFTNGKEQHPHITVLYGLVNDKDYFSIRAACQKHGPIELEIGNIKAFRNPDSDCDVLVHEIHSEALHRLNATLSQFENKNSFPDYIPHMTLAYVKKGALAEYEGKPTSLTGEKYMANKIVFSHVDGYTLEIPLGPEQQTAPTRVSTDL